MRVARHRSGDEVRVGVLDGEELVDLDGTGVLELLAASPPERERRALQGSRVPLESASLLAPVERPGKFLAVGFNFADHAAETPKLPELEPMYESIRYTRLAHPDPTLPTVFNKQTTCIAGPFDPVWLPRDARMLDYEGELALVIGRRARRASERQAAEAIAAYCVCNDVSVREWQLDTPTMWPGKSFDTHGPLGPWLVTADALDPDGLSIRTWVNGELRQDGSTGAMILSPARLVSRISQVCTLEPGDVIATGTPAGIGTPTGRFLRVGDVVRIEVQGIGAIENTVIDEPSGGAA
ncbi:MAG TPA: fumarylacetoacetate hydrolase family protein [Solirubrobacteraceae bacterium]|jgi:2-keto-4-pentenoate hydratase/2-oxohepta-3-ene-1,7-dioic acid hydratase in catechol pathway|nr:fumarylacetoacetate hydrolase family protein [Solirubrobacteraceae bacterium]